MINCNILIYIRLVHHRHWGILLYSRFLSPSKMFRFPIYIPCIGEYSFLIYTHRVTAKKIPSFDKNLKSNQIFGLREIDKREIGTREKEEKWLLLLFGAAKK
ncbi:hypothetical protein QL285_071993 [Trifolium repens]|nr:hypothetical protein QL285_071993 [Trifolium repens]